MTIFYKVQGYDLTTTNLTTVLTINVSSVALVKEISVANDDSTAVEANYFFHDISETTDYKFYHASVAANSHDNAVHNVLVLEAGDSLKFQVGTANKISGQISFALINRSQQNG
jgi:hypothetical protein